MFRLLLVAVLALTPVFVSAEKPQRVITLGGAITETVFELNAGHRVIAVDEGSTHPRATSELPRVGQLNNLDVDFILALKPDLVIASHRAGPKDALKKLEVAGIHVVIIQVGPGIEQALNAIEQVGEVLQSKSGGRWLARDTRRTLQRVKARYGRDAEKLKVLFIQDEPDREPLLSGENTTGAIMIELAGGTNAISGVNRHLHATKETLGGLAPDIIVAASSGWSVSEELEQLLNQSGIARTLAERNGRLVVMPSNLLLGMGPRIGSAALQLAEAMREDAEDFDEY